jgi:hypothetical protein
VVDKELENLFFLDFLMKIGFVFYRAVLHVCFSLLGDKSKVLFHRMILLALNGNWFLEYSTG